MALIFVLYTLVSRRLVTRLSSIQNILHILHLLQDLKLQSCPDVLQALKLQSCPDVTRSQSGAYSDFSESIVVLI
jgi:alkyl hydroperoxide reductase subunit AhpF